MGKNSSNPVILPSNPSLDSIPVEPFDKSPTAEQVLNNLVGKNSSNPVILPTNSSLDSSPVEPIDKSPPAEPNKKSNQRRKKSKEKKKVAAPSSSTGPPERPQAPAKAPPKHPSQHKPNDKSLVIIAGDSIIKYVQGSDPERRIAVKSFSGATTEDMDDYIKPLSCKEPDLLVFHVGTNDISSVQDPRSTAEGIVNLATLAQQFQQDSPSSDVAISAILRPADKTDFNTKID